MSTPTHGVPTTHRSGASSSGEKRTVHVSQKSVPPADVTSRADGPEQLDDLAETAGPPETTDPAQTSDSAGEPEITLVEQPCRPSTAESAGLSRVDEPARLEPAASADPAGIAGPSQDHSGEVSHNVSLPSLMHDEPPLDQIPVTHQRPADNPDVSVDSRALIFPSIPKLFNQMQLLEYIAMMNLAQQKGMSRDEDAGPATVFTPRAVVRKSPSQDTWEVSVSLSSEKVSTYNQDRSL